jgi:probable phosphoglycerate mutase
MTAEAVARATGAPIEFDPLLQERNFGDVRGTAYEELGVDLFGPDYEPPGGESWAEFDERVRRAWQRVEEVAARCEGDLAVVTHGLVCRAVAADFVVAAAGDVSAADTAATFLNTSLTVLRGPTPWSLELLACSAHLDGEFPTDGAPA